MSRTFEAINNAFVDKHKMPSDVCLNEARDVFIDGNRLVERWKALPREQASGFVIAEIGFGHGLNFLLAWSLWKKYAPSTSKLHFISSECHPFSHNDLSTCLKFLPELEEQAEHLLDQYPLLTPGYHLMLFDEGRVSLTLMLGDTLSSYREQLLCSDIKLERELRESFVDAWFLNAPNQLQKADALFVTMSLLSKPETTCSPIVAGGEALVSPKTKKLTPWHVSTHKTVKKKHALVLGAGLAGCYTAHALAGRGWSVSLLDADGEVGEGASGNQSAILFPQLSAFSSPLATFMLTSFLFASKTYKRLLQKHSIGELSGLLQLAYDDKERTSQENLKKWLASYPELGQLVDAVEASDIAGIPLPFGGLFIPHSGWIDSPALCQRLIKAPGIYWHGHTEVGELVYEEGEWHANGHHAEVLVLANGYRANAFQETTHLPLSPVRGQMTFISSNALSHGLKVPLCGDGHIIPANDGLHGLGATYQPGLVDRRCYAIDDHQNISKLAGLTPGFLAASEVVGHWAGVRAATPDYLPLVGPVDNPAGFKKQFAALEGDSNRWIPSPAIHYDGLYVCAGFGSRGLTTIPLSAEWLASIINKEPSCLPRAMVQSLSPARFLRRAIIRRQ